MTAAPHANSGLLSMMHVHAKSLCSVCLSYKAFCLGSKAWKQIKQWRKRGSRTC